MRLKHWQGYGCVNAKRIEYTINQDRTKTIKIEVTGSHEYGLVQNDRYDVHRWLMTRFAKDCPDYRAITDMVIDTPDDTTAIYVITYQTNI